MPFLSRRYLLPGSIAFVTLWLWLSLNREHLPNNVDIWNAYNNGPQSLENDVFDFPPVDNADIKSMCNNAPWNSSLVFTCDNNHGGIGHVRNSILNCVRYAISAGGALVLPRIALRDEEEKEGLGHEHQHVDKRHGPGRKGMDFMFDQNHFVQSLRTSCPDLDLIRHIDETTSNRRRGLSPESLFENISTSGIYPPHEFPDRLASWMEKYIAKGPQNEPIIIDLEQSFLQYPTHSDGHGVAHHFGNILKFRADVRYLATTTLKKIAEWYDMDWNISDPIIQPSFFGAHLMTETPLTDKRHASDVLYTHFQSQASAYLEQAQFLKIPIMYVGSGNVPEVQKLGLQGEQYNVAVTHKEDLLKGKDLEQLERLTCDQRALVDYLVLLKGQHFAGVGHSTFSWNVAKKRHEVGDHVKGSLEGEMWEDSQSTLYGVRESYVESSGCMWS